MDKFSLAALLSKVNLDNDEKEFCSNGLKGLPNQQDFFDYCKQWKLAPWIYSQLINYDLLGILDKAIIENFKQEFSKVRLQNEQRSEVAAELLSEFIDAGIDVVILKGNFLAQSCYNEVGYKRMNDFDILVRREDWDKIQDIYIRLDYIPLGFGWSGEKEKPASFSHVGMSFISRDFRCIVGSQWGLKSPTTQFSVDIDKVWETAADFTFNGLKVKSLSPEYNLLHLILHLGVFKCGIRDCMDLYNLVQTEKIDWELMRQIIVESNATDKANFAMEICNLCVDGFSKQFIDGLNAKKNGFLSRRLIKRKKVSDLTGDFQNSYNDYFQDIEKQVIYFNIFPKFHDKFILYLRIMKMIYFPKIEFSLRLNDQLKEPIFINKIISALKAPYFVFSLIAQEIGWKFTCLLFMKLAFDLLISLKNYIVAPQSYFDYLKTKGIDPKDIQKAVKNIQ